jgi:hypothetical protein
MAEEKEFAEMNLTDHAGAWLTHGKPKVNGVEDHPRHLDPRFSG